jgi:hypothetical protein
MYTAIKAGAPNTVVVWAPNYSYGYPFGMQLPANASDAAALDTNHDGIFTAADDAYSPSV